MIGNSLADVEAPDPRWNWLYRVAGASAFIVFVLFMVGSIGIITAGSQPTTTTSWLAPFQNNWLVVLFLMNIAARGVEPNAINIFNFLDLIIMVLVGVIFLALYAALRRISKIWALVAVSLSFLGIPLFLFTGTAGRSGLLFGGLIISIVMWRSNVFSKTSAYVGITASALLFFAGDIGTALFSPSNIIAVLIGFGYALWVIWFLLISHRCFQLGYGKPN